MCEKFYKECPPIQNCFVIVGTLECQRYVPTRLPPFYISDFFSTYPILFRAPSPPPLIDFGPLLLLLGSKRVRDLLPNFHENQRTFMIHENQNYVESGLKVMVYNSLNAICFSDLT